MVFCLFSFQDDIQQAPQKRTVVKKISPEKNASKKTPKITRRKDSSFGNKLKKIYREELETKLPFITLDTFDPFVLVMYPFLAVRRLL